MRAIRASGLALVFLLLSGLSAQVAAADEAEALYDPSAVVFIDLTLPEPEKAKLEAAPDEYVKGTVSMTKSSDGTPGGEEPTPFIASRPVEVRLKGSVGGSFRELSGKAGFKLKFKKADAVLGLRKMTLNNMVQDPSMVHETLAYAAFRAAGVPASRTGFAYLRVNGEDFGVYLNLENLDDIALVKLFGSFDDETQHLYEGERGDDVFPGGAAGFEIDEGPDDRSDLEALVDAVNAEGAPFSTRVASRANLAEMAKMWAVEKYSGHWDGYSGHTDSVQAEKGERPNNYYLYGEPSGRFQMLPWGTDQAWIPTADAPGRIVTFDGSGGVLFNKCLEDDECFRVYWEALRGVTDAIATLDPGALAEDTASLLLPWQEEEVLASTREEHSIGEAEDGVEESLGFIAGRQAEAEAWLGENEPPPFVVVDPVDEPQNPKTQPLAHLPGPAALFSRLGRAGRHLTVRLQIAGPGTATLRGTIRTPKGKRKVCSAGLQAKGPGEIALACRLSSAAMDRLAERALRVKIAITIVLADGRTETIPRSIRLPRSPGISS
ncbi:MAG TPA: CotH kinase family protein [Solirubrobacterales bacterium]|nr:CotH kinase family protein [Solirubrobacterales bacterium]